MSQPDPIHNAHRSVHDEVIALLEQVSGPDHDTGAVIAAMQERKRKGLETYNTILQPFNGRDALQDALEELLDAAAYMQQRLLELGDAWAASKEYAVLQHMLHSCLVHCETLLELIEARNDKGAKA